ncbi:MAG: nitrile hydratase subunit beta [Rhizobiales bacterium]|nr:nitrile hydratase subunit beta [Hyphomicrobiales bacterium]
MNGPQDMGGHMGFGPVVSEPDEPVFHADWERRVLAFTIAMGATGSWNIDISRHAREKIPALTYWSSSYYAIWLEGLIKLMTERGLVTEAEVASGRVQVPAKPVKRMLKAELVLATLAKGGPASRLSNTQARFKAGNRVQARNINSEHHTRLPRYARGKVGEIILVHGTHVFPDSSAHGLGDDPQWLYTVRFSARELWGKDGRDHVHIDLWEPYLEAH